MLHVLDFSMGIITLKALWAVREISSCSAVATDMTILLFPRMVAANVLYTNRLPSSPGTVDEEDLLRAATFYGRHDGVEDMTLRCVE